MRIRSSKHMLIILSAYVRSNGEWIARSLLMGFFVAPVEALPEISVTDIYFTHQRGTYMGIYSFALAGSNYFAPVICGFIAERQGWQWVFYWPAIFNAVTFVFLFFFMEESNYQRQTVVASATSNPATAVSGAELGDQEKARSVTSQSAASILAAITWPERVPACKAKSAVSQLARHCLLRI
jgi:MFS family permease